MNVAWSLYLSTLLLVAAFPRADAQTTIIRATALVDVEAGRLVQPAVVIVKDDRIQSVNPPSVPEGQQVDLRDLILDILRHGKEVEVLGPTELRQAVVRELGEARDQDLRMGKAVAHALSHRPYTLGPVPR